MGWLWTWNMHENGQTDGQRTTSRKQHENMGNGMTFYFYFSLVVLFLTYYPDSKSIWHCRQWVVSAVHVRVCFANERNKCHDFLGFFNRINVS